MMDIGNTIADVKDEIKAIDIEIRAMRRLCGRHDRSVMADGCMCV